MDINANNGHHGHAPKHVHCTPSIRPVARGGGGGGSEESYDPPPLTAEGPHFGHTSSTRGMNPFLEFS